MGDYVVYCCPNVLRLGRITQLYGDRVRISEHQGKRRDPRFQSLMDIRKSHNVIRAPSNADLAYTSALTFRLLATESKNEL